MSENSNSYQKGISYEDFVESVYQAILEAENRLENVKPIDIQRRRKIKSKSGTKGEIDIYWEYEMAGIKLAVAIECRNLKGKVGIAGVRDFARKISNISGLKGIMVSPIDFTKGAKQEADSDQIDLIVIRPPDDSDWEDSIKEIHLNLTMLSPAKTQSVKPYLDGNWCLENDISATDGIEVNVRNDLLIFEDRSNGFRHSLHELQQNNFFEARVVGSHKWTKKFDDGWLIVDESEYKLSGVEIEYNISEPFEIKRVINFEEYVLAIMDWVNNDKGRTTVMKDGSVE